MYKSLDDRIRKALRHHIHERYHVDVPVVTERPPRLNMGEVASPVCFELAKRLKKPPRALAQEIANSIKPIEGVARMEVAGGGYLNAFIGRPAFFRGMCKDAGHEATAAKPIMPKTVVEHTNINPNKAAHIGHLRNATLGDTFVRMLRASGAQVEVQNYIDNTGVQVADVVVGFHFLEQKTPAEVEALLADPAVALRLLLLGSVRARHAISRRGQSPPGAARANAERHRGRARRTCRRSRKSFRRQSSAATCKRSTGWALITTYCPAKAKYCT